MQNFSMRPSELGFISGLRMHWNPTVYFVNRNFDTSASSAPIETLRSPKAVNVIVVNKTESTRDIKVSGESSESGEQTILTKTLGKGEKAGFQSSQSLFQVWNLVLDDSEEPDASVTSEEAASWSAIQFEITSDGVTVGQPVEVGGQGFFSGFGTVHAPPTEKLDVTFVNDTPLYRLHVKLYEQSGSDRKELVSKRLYKNGPRTGQYPNTWVKEVTATSEDYYVLTVHSRDADTNYRAPTPTYNGKEASSVKILSSKLNGAGKVTITVKMEHDAGLSALDHWATPVSYINYKVDWDYDESETESGTESGTSGSGISGIGMISSLFSVA